MYIYNICIYYIYVYITYNIIPCHTTMPYHAYPITYHNTIPCIPHHIYTIPCPLAIFPVLYSLCPVTYIKYSQSTILFLKVAKKWSRDYVTLLQDSMADGMADSEADCFAAIGFCCYSGTQWAPAAAGIVCSSVCSTLLVT